MFCERAAWRNGKLSHNWEKSSSSFYFTISVKQQLSSFQMKNVHHWTESLLQENKWLLGRGGGGGGARLGVPECPEGKFKIKMTTASHD